MPDRARPPDGRADHDVQRAVATIISRGGDPDVLALEVHQAYLGRGWTAPVRPATEYCPVHHGTRMTRLGCPTCGPAIRDDPDDEA